MMTPEVRNIAAQEPSMKRWGKPDEAAKVVCCIGDNTFSYVTSKIGIV